MDERNVELIQALLAPVVSSVFSNQAPASVKGNCPIWNIGQYHGLVRPCSSQGIVSTRSLNRLDPCMPSPVQPSLDCYGASNLPKTCSHGYYSLYSIYHPWIGTELELVANWTATSPRIGARLPLLSPTLGALSDTEVVLIANLIIPIAFMNAWAFPSLRRNLAPGYADRMKFT